MLRQVVKIGCCVLVLGLLSIPAWGMGSYGLWTPESLILANGGHGPGDGDGNGGEGPGDGSGNGAPDGAGDCPGARTGYGVLIAGNGNQGAGDNGGHGPGDGDGNGGEGPEDGSGFGAPDGAGDCPGAKSTAGSLLAAGSRAGKVVSSQTRIRTRSQKQGTTTAQPAKVRLMERSRAGQQN